MAYRLRGKKNKRSFSNNANNVNRRNFTPNQTKGIHRGGGRL